MLRTSKMIKKLAAVCMRVYAMIKPPCLDLGMKSVCSVIVGSHKQPIL